MTELDKPDKFITELASHRRRAVRAYPAGTAPATVVFNLSDAGAVMTSVVFEVFLLGQCYARANL